MDYFNIIDEIFEENIRSYDIVEKYPSIFKNPFLLLHLFLEKIDIVKDINPMLLINSIFISTQSFLNDFFEEIHNNERMLYFVKTILEIKEIINGRINKENEK